MKHIVVPVELSGRNAATARSQREAQNWRPLARGVLYRLPQDGRDVQVDELDIPYPQSVQELRLRVDSRGSGLGNQAPSIRVGMNGSQIVFLAEGHAPYQLAFGNAKAQAAQLLKFIEALEELDDVQNVYANFDIPDDLLEDAAKG